MKEYEIVATHEIYLVKKITAENEIEANKIASQMDLSDWDKEGSELIIQFLHDEPFQLKLGE